jgi:hypothetical protein
VVCADGRRERVTPVTLYSQSYAVNARRERVRPASAAALAGWLVPGRGRGEVVAGLLAAVRLFRWEPRAAR